MCLSSCSSSSSPPSHILFFLYLLFPLVKDLLLLKATSAATLSCLGDCLTMLQHSVAQAFNQNQSQNQNHNYIPSPSLSHSSAGLNQAAPKEKVKLWGQRFTSSVNQVEPGGLRSSCQSLTHSFSESRSLKHSSSSRRRGSGHNQIQSQSQCQDLAHTGELVKRSEKLWVNCFDGDPIDFSSPLR